MWYILAGEATPIVFHIALTILADGWIMHRHMLRRLFFLKSVLKIFTNFLENPLTRFFRARMLHFDSSCCDRWSISLKWDQQETHVQHAVCLHLKWPRFVNKNRKKRDRKQTGRWCSSWVEMILIRLMRMDCSEHNSLLFAWMCFI